MALGGFFKNLFGGGSESSGEPKSADPVEYKGYEIRPAPRSSGSQWNVAGTITRGRNGEMREHRFIRADSNATWDGAVELTVMKAKQMIDNEGDRIFDKQSAF